MNTIKYAIHSFLANNSDVLNLVSTRIYPNAAPQSVVASTQQYIVFINVGGENEKDVSGTSGFARDGYSFNCWSSSDAGAWGVAEVVRTKLDGLRSAVFGVGTGNQVNLRSCMLRAYRDNYVLPIDGQDFGRFCASLDFVFQYIETVTPS